MEPEPRVVAGHVYRPGEGFTEGWVAVAGGRVVERGEGKPPRPPEAHGVVLPALVNAHTHVGDRVARGVDFAGKSLAEVVAPPEGLKHRILRATPPEALRAGMRQAVDELAASGCRAFLDFREQGPDGARLLVDAAAGASARPIVLGRPADAWDDAGIEAVLQVADGIGLPSLADVPEDAPERAAASARRRDKRFALHLSEARREDVGRALDLAPDFVVHVCAAAPEDVDALAEAGVPVVLCPRSNALFGRAPPVEALLDAGAVCALGSDNAMFHSLDVLDDARFLARANPDAPRQAFLDMAIEGGRILRDEAVPSSYLEKGDEGALVVLPLHGDDPWDSVFGARPTWPRRAPF